MIRPGLIKEATDAFVKIHKEIGFKNLKRYILIAFLILGVFYIKPISTGIVKFVIEISEDIHTRRMVARDTYMTELSPLLIELRTRTGADRALYFEFHNSEESLEGLPFKFFDVMLGSSRYGLGEGYANTYININASKFTTFFNDLAQGKILYCKGLGDNEFRHNYEGVHEFFNSVDYSEQQVMFSIPGIKFPIGFIVLEWTNENTKICVKDDIEPIVHEIIPRINALAIQATQY